MTTEQLEKIADKIEKKQKWFEERRAYAKGINPTIYQELPKSAPDFRISVPFVKKAITQYSGYMLRSGSITYSGKYYDNNLKDIYDFNDEQLVNSLEFMDALTYGKCYELHWVDKDGKEKNFHPIPTEQGMPVYSDDLKKKLIGFYWLREIEDENDNETCVLTYWDETTQYEWRKSENGKEWIEQPEVKHAYGVVPVNIGHISEDHSNIFDHVKDMIDFYDKLISGDIANESQRYVNALLLMADRIDDQTTDSTGRTMVDRLRELMMLDSLGDDPSKKVAYLTKDIPTEFIKFACDTIYNHIHDLMPMIDQRDDNLGTASGVAQEFRLLPFEYRCADIEANFSRFLYNRMYLIAGAQKGMGNDSTGVYDIQISFKRNLPKNVAEIFDNASKAVGILSEETILRMFPSDIVPDVEKELEALKKEQAEVTMPETSTTSDANGNLVTNGL